MGRRRNGLVSGVWVLLLFVAVFGVVLNVPVVWGSGTIYIRADGSIDPPTAPIYTTDNITYTFADNINDHIVVERSNIVIDGAAYTLQGFGTGSENDVGFYLSSVNNVTIKNTTIRSFWSGLLLKSSSFNTISGNNITGNDSGVMLPYQGSFNNTILGNNITNNGGGVSIGSSSPSNTVSKNSIRNNVLGVHLGSSFNTVSENNITNNRLGIYTQGGPSNNTILENNITNNDRGIYLYWSSFNTLSGNNITNNNNYGLNFEGTSYNKLRNNIMASNRYNFDVSGSTLSHFIHDIDTSNTVDGKPIRYLIDQANLKLNPLTYPEVGYLALVNSNNITIEGFELKGMLLAYTTNSKIKNNMVTSSVYGIRLYQSSFNILSGNNVTNTRVGVFLGYSSYNEVAGNNITGNEEGGIYISTEWSSTPLYNNVADNNIADNGHTGIAIGASQNTVTGNNITRNSRYGVWTVGYNIISDNNMTSNACGIYTSGYSAPTWSRNNIVDNQIGIELVGSHGKTFSGNNIISNGVGITLSTSSGNVFSDNNVINNGIGIHDEGGIMEYSGYNGYYSNNITGNGGGIYLHGYGASYNTFSGNMITYNGVGVQLSDQPHGNVLSNNTIVRNDFGIYLYDSSNNKIFHNNFLYNTEQVRNKDSTNIWDDGYPSGGNYWTDYNGTDPDGDGIGNTPYIIDEDNQDNYPLTKAYGDFTPPITFHDYDGLWRTADFTITLTSTDNFIVVAETYYEINDGPTKTVNANGQPLITTESANNTLEYWSVDNAGNEELPHKILTGIKLDKTAPTGSITINNDAPYTNSTSVMLTLTAIDATSDIYQVRYSNDGVWDTEPWETPSSTKAWTLTSGDETKTVYYQIKDNAGFVSITYSDIITLDTTPPTGSISIAGDAAYTNSTSVTLTLSADDATSGVAQIRFSNDNFDWTPWEPYSTSKTWTLTTGDGAKTVYVQFKDNAGLISSIYKDSIILDSIQPTANAGSDQTVNEDTLVTFDASASTDENGISTYTWTFTDKTPQTLSGKNPTYTFTTPGTYTITLRVTDPAGNTATDTVIITVFDVTKPIANAGSDRTVNEDTQITLDGSASSDNVAITAYTWTFTDVTVKTLTGAKPTYTFNTPGVYTITLNVTDAAENWATDTIVITVLDVTKPVANAGQNQTVNVGTTVTFDAGASSDNVGIVSYEWNFGDETAGTGKTTTHTYASQGTYTVTLTVKDAAGNTATHSIEVTVLAAEAFPMWIIGVAIAAIAIVTASTVIFWRRRKHPPTK